MSLNRQHWDTVYRDKPAEKLSWRQAAPGPSLAALDRIGASPANSLIDIGGGQSNLVDALLARDWSDLTVLDIADVALAATRIRLGDQAKSVQWIVADVTKWRPQRKYDLWHDRAVFHFLLTLDERDAYRAALRGGLQPGGHAVFATFAPDGPERCSGLPVHRYAAAELAAEFGGEMKLDHEWREEHMTPAGSVQAFTWAVLRRSG